MSDSGQDYKLNVRLPKVLEDHIKSYSDKFKISLNDTVKIMIIQHLEAHSGYKLGPTDGPTDGPKTKRKRKKVGPTDGATDGAKDTAPSRACEVYESKYINIYKINKGILVFENPILNDLWLKFKRHRNKLKKPITADTEVYQLEYVDKVLAHEGEAGMIERLKKTLQHSWQGFLFKDENLAGNKNTQHKYEDNDL